MKKKVSLVGEELECSHPGCRKKAVSLGDHCWEHIPDKVKYIEVLKQHLESKKTGEGFILQKIVLRDSDLLQLNFKNVDLSQADLTNSNLSYSDLSNANLIGTCLENTDLTGATLKSSDLTRANMRSSRLWHADLSCANASEADMSGSDLWKCQMFCTRLWHTKLRNVKSLTKQNFTKIFYRILSRSKVDERGLLAAEESYLSLKQYFMENGRYREASWASFKEKTMEQLILKKGKNPAYIPMAVMGLLSGYGEKPNRVITSSVVIVAIYSLLYRLFNAAVIELPSSPRSGIWDYVYYSIVTFTTLGYGDIVPKADIASRLLAGSEAFIGAFMIGLFVFTLSRKYSAR